MKNLISVIVMFMVVSFAVAKQFDLETLKIAAAEKVACMYLFDTKTDEIMAAIEKAIVDGWVSDRLYLVQGKVFEDVGNHTKATESFSKALQLSNYKYDMYEEIIGFYAENEEYENSINVINQCLNREKTVNSNDANRIKNLTDLSSVYKIMDLYTKGEYDSAKIELIRFDNETSIEGVEKICECFRDIYYSEEDNRSKSWITSESSYKTTKSYQFLNVCISEVSSCSLAYLLMCHIEIVNEDYSAAISNATKALALHPLFVDFTSGLIWLSLELSDYESAYEVYQLLMFSESEDLLRLQKASNSINDAFAYSSDWYRVEEPIEEVAPVDTSWVDIRYEYTPSSISEFGNKLILFYNWIKVKYPEDKYANWLHARVLADYNVYDCRQLLKNANHKSVYDESLIAYTYYLEYNYQRSLSMIEQISSEDAVSLVFTKDDLLCIYSECGLYDRVIGMLCENDYDPNLLVIRESLYLQKNPNAVFTLLDAFSNHIVDAAPSMAVVLKGYSDEIAYTFINRLLDNKSVVMKLMSNIFSKNTITFANLLVDMGQETQAKEIIKNTTLSKSSDLYGECMKWGEYYKDVKQYSEAISYYNLAHYVYENISYPILEIVECNFKNSKKKEARELLLKLNLSEERGYDWAVFNMFIESPGMVLEYYDWVTENVGYYWRLAYELYKMGEYEKATEYIELKGRMDDNDLLLYNPAKKIASNPDWKPFITKDGFPYESDDSVVMYHPETIKHDQSSITIWIKFLKTKEVDNSYDFVESKELWRVDVNKKQYKTIQGVNYYKGGDRRDINPSTDWEYPIPDTIGYYILEELVKKHKKLRAAAVKKR